MVVAWSLTAPSFSNKISGFVLVESFTSVAVQRNLTFEPNKTNNKRDKSDTKIQKSIIEQRFDSTLKWSGQRLASCIYHS